MSGVTVDRRRKLLKCIPITPIRVVKEVGGSQGPRIGGPGAQAPFRTDRRTPEAKRSFAMAGRPESGAFKKEGEPQCLS
jgi:hypothetical protein